MAQRISSPRFVGRASELEAFEQLVRRAEEGAGCALMVAGEAGIGKSRFLSEIELRLRQAKALVLAGECVEVAEGELAFAPIVAALRPVMDDGGAVHELDPPLRAALAALWPAVGEAGTTSREQLFEAVYRVLARLAERRLVVLMIEDLHWIDRSSTWWASWCAMRGATGSCSWRRTVRTSFGEAIHCGRFWPSSSALGGRSDSN